MFLWPGLTVQVRTTFPENEDASFLNKKIWKLTYVNAKDKLRRSQVGPIEEERGMLVA